MNIFDLIKKNSSKNERDLLTIQVILHCTRTSLSKEQIADTAEAWKYVEKLYLSFEQYQKQYEETQDSKAYNILENNYYSVQEMLENLKNDLYPHYRIDTIVFLENLKLEELKQFSQLYFEIINQVTNPVDAYKYVFIHSGKELSEFIQKVLDYCRRINFHDKYVQLDKLNELSMISRLDYIQWVKTFLQLNMLMKSIRSNDQEFLELKKDFMLIRVYYFIIISTDSGE